MFQFGKIMVPHIILILILLCYLCVGAAVLQRIETPDELSKRGQKAVKLKELYHQIAQETWELKSKDSITSLQWRNLLQQYMLQISQTHDQRFTVFELEDFRNMSTRWTFPTALLYALTVLTTCGKTITYYTIIAIT